MTPCSSLTTTLSDAKSDNSTPGGEMAGSSRSPDTAWWTGLAIARRLLPIAARTRTCQSQRRSQMTKQGVTADRFCQTRMSAALHGARSGRRTGVGRHDDHRHPGADVPQPPQQVESAEARHAHIGNQAIEPVRDVVRHKGLRSIVSATRQILHHKEIGKGLSHGFIVIYDRN